MLVLVLVLEVEVEVLVDLEVDVVVEVVVVEVLVEVVLVVLFVVVEVEEADPGRHWLNKSSFSSIPVPSVIWLTNSRGLNRCKCIQRHKWWRRSCCWFRILIFYPVGIWIAYHPMPPMPVKYEHVIVDINKQHTALSPSPTLGTD